MKKFLKKLKDKHNLWGEKLKYFRTMTGEEKKYIKTVKKEEINKSAVNWSEESSPRQKRNRESDSAKLERKLP